MIDKTIPEKLHFVKRHTKSLQERAWDRANDVLKSSPIVRAAISFGEKKG